MFRQLWGLVLCIVLSRHECHVLGTIVSECSVRADLEAGSICGTLRNYTTTDGVEKFYASFRGVPYAEQPVGESRFKPLQPLQPWEGILDTSVEGPICPQVDIFYGPLLQPHGISESCIHANIHVPIETFQKASAPYNCRSSDASSGLPVFVFLHGGAFAMGSGDGDIQGPEYLLDKDVIVVTFNYRLGITGFLSLNTTEVPGNNGLRDIVTLLNWVKTNIASFGGNPNEVTLAGQSAGSSAVFLLTLSTAAEGLFKRAICMSGAAIRSTLAMSPVYAQTRLQTLLSVLNITATDTEQIYEQLKLASLPALLNATSSILALGGNSIFYPTIENKLPGVTPILDDDPENLLAQGRGRDIPILFSFTNSEADIFRNRYESTNLATRAQTNTNLLIPPKILYYAPPETLPEVVKEIEQEYFQDNITTLTTDTFIRYSTDSYFMYPVLFVARKRAELGGAPVYLAQFSYEGDYRVFEEAFGLDLNGATHGEDLTYLMEVHSIPGPSERSQADLDMQDWLPELYSNFAKTGSPSPSWPPLVANELQYQAISEPKVLQMSQLTEQQRRVLEFFDQLYENV